MYRIRIGRPSLALLGASAVNHPVWQNNVEKLSQAGRAKRSRPRRLPDFYSVSNTLRTVGAYLDAKGVELVELHKRPISITLSYRDKEGHQQGEDRPVSSFYNLFLELYGKRGQQKTLTVKHPNSQPSALTT